ncbi:hypothetical protein A2U01_0086110, partial [Trifolium medium]|nr:hypothetical protein [Trifolium medium]
KQTLPKANTPTANTTTKPPLVPPLKGTTAVVTPKTHPKSSRSAPEHCTSVTAARKTSPQRLHR